LRTREHLVISTAKTSGKNMVKWTNDFMSLPVHAAPKVPMLLCRFAGLLPLQRHRLGVFAEIILWIISFSCKYLDEPAFVFHDFIKMYVLPVNM
jgi:hypothetical protein